MSNLLSRRYLVAIAASGAAVLIHLALSPVLGEKAPLIFSVLAVITASRYGGKLPGLLATFLCALGSLFFLPLVHIKPFGEGVALLLFAAVGTGISLLSGQLQDALRKTAESEERYRGMSEALPHLIWTARPDGECDHLNHRWVAYTGIPAEKQYGRGWQQQIHPDDMQAIQDAWKDSTVTGESVQVEFRVRRYDGAYHWFDARAVALRGPDGAIVKWVGSCTDIQLTHELWNSLRREAERFSGIASTVPGFIFSFHLAGARAGSVPMRTLM